MAAETRPVVLVGGADGSKYCVDELRSGPDRRGPGSGCISDKWKLMVSGSLSGMALALEILYIRIAVLKICQVERSARGETGD